MWTEAEGRDLAEQLTEALRTPEGTQTLRPVQAIALVELAQMGGLFAPIRVGGGKTLISALAAMMLGAERTLLLVPDTEKTRRELLELRHHWHMPELLMVRSYKLIGHPKSGAVLDEDGRIVTPDIMERCAPDLIVGDECHLLKRPGAAVTKRVTRYLKAHKDCKLLAMTGTPITHSLMDCGHLVGRALGRRAPVPLSLSSLVDWAQALENDDADAIGGREGFRRRFVESRGVVVHDVPFTGVGLTISKLPLDPPPVVLEALETLRDQWELPDGSKLVEAFELWAHARQLALGFFYRWRDTPPREWLEARSEWSAECRRLVGANRRNLDSPKPIIDAIERLGLYPEAAPILARWKAVKDTYEPVTVATWLHPFAAEAAAAWLGEPGICWTEHDAFAERVAELAGAPYFGAGARDSNGIYIMDASGPIVASWHSCATGLNLQGTWWRNLVTSVPGAKVWEQLVGRTHREGQRSDVLVEWFRCCEEHDESYAKAIDRARFVQETTGLQQKVMTDG